jgi:hypothetical protein
MRAAPRFSPNGRTLIVAYDDGRAFQWRSASDATQIAFSPHAVWLAAAAGPTAVDPVTAKTQPARAIPAGSQSSAGIAVVGNEVWIAYTAIGTLVRIRPSG